MARRFDKLICGWLWDIVLIDEGRFGMANMDKKVTDEKNKAVNVKDPQGVNLEQAEFEWKFETEDSALRKVAILSLTLALMFYLIGWLISNLAHPAPGKLSSLSAVFLIPLAFFGSLFCGLCLLKGTRSKEEGAGIQYFFIIILVGSILNLSLWGVAKLISMWVGYG